MNIVLVGMMGSGKTTVGKPLARKLKMRFTDADAEIVRTAGMSIAEIFQTRGEAYFRKLEQKTLRRICGKSRQVIAAGGGAACFEQNWKSFRKKKSLVVWLKTTPAELYRRLKKPGQIVRPLLKKEELSLTAIQSILNKRERYYRRADLLLEKGTAAKTAKMIALYIDQFIP